MKMMTILLISLCLAISTSCDEFYDEEFENDSTAISLQENVTFQMNLFPTDPSVTDLTGDATIEISGDVVNVTVNIQGIPQNISQIHYGFSSISCSELPVVLPVEVGVPRTYIINETLSRTALEFDVSSGGVEITNIEGESFIIKAFSNVTSSTVSTGGIYTIACGEIRILNDINLEEATTDF